MAINLDTPDSLAYNFYPVSNGIFSFKVRAANDAHVMLASGPSEEGNVVEIFIGGWGNSKSVIRRNKTKPEKAEANTPDVLNAGEYRAFWIRWFDGVYTVGNDGEAAAFLSWQDPEPFPIQFAGVCTGWGATGSWIIDGAPEFKTADSLAYSFQPIRSGSVVIEFSGPSNCHVALLSSPSEQKPLTEIMLGGWDNKACAIRCDGNKATDFKVDTPNVCSASCFRTFYITWTNGYLSVREGAPNGKIIIDRENGVNFPVTHIGVRTAWGASGKWKILIGGASKIDSIESARFSKPNLSAASPSAPPQNIGFSAANLTGGGGPIPVWIPSSGGQFPPGAIAGGQDGGDILYVARAHHNGEIIPGKLVPSHGNMYIPWGGAEHAFAEYEVLVGGNLNWVATSGTQVPGNAFVAGESEGGEPLFIGRANHDGAVTIGKVQPSHGCVYVPYGGAELSFPEYEILVQ